MQQHSPFAEHLADTGSRLLRFLAVSPAGATTAGQADDRCNPDSANHHCRPPV